ncbi:protein quick-to-court isoform X2 [Onthophagus taurus]|uniref:protein quick-to-court isoform X2 n=1 Tax=Onthophagus taurus TaxID=166361 RepID=UPI0039BE735B
MSKSSHIVSNSESTTKIPTLRRSGSLRSSTNLNFRRSIDSGSFAASPSHKSGVATAALQRPPPPPRLQRGYSFVEKGTVPVVGGDGLQRRRFSISTGGRRRKNVTTEGSTIQEPQNGGANNTPSRSRSLSLSLSTTHLGVPKPSTSRISSPKTPPVSPEVRKKYKDWDTESLTSINSGLSVASSCDHASVALNGTTFSGRSMKYVVHCNQHAGVTGEDYLTPTQRAHRQVKKLKYLLQQAQKDLEQRDNDIVKLTKEVVELRLYKAALSSPEDKSNSSDAVTVRENPTDEQATPDDLIDTISNHLVNDMSCSYADSGHYDDFTNSSIHSKDSSVVLSEDFNPSPYKQRKHVLMSDKSTSVDTTSKDFQQEHQELIMEYEKRLHELIRTHEEETHVIKQKHNDKVEELLQRITEINSRYWQLVPELDCAREKIKELEKELDEACKNLEDTEEKNKKMYLQMYKKGEEAAKIEQENKVMEIAVQHPSRISVPELLHQLQITQTELDNIKAMYRQLMEAKNAKNKIDPEITLQFLKSAIYYFLTDKENSQGHLKAIQSILGFTPAEINQIDKNRTN